jgi:hypothetical protein
LRLLCSASAIVILLVAPGVAAGAVRCVPAEAPGCDSGHGTITNAVANADPGDTIRIAAGLYTGPGLPVDKRLHFEGASQGTLDTFDPAVHTRIRGPNNGPGMTLEAGGSLRSLQVVGGTGAPNSNGEDAVVLDSDGADVAYSVEQVVAIGGDRVTNGIGTGGSGLVASSSSGSMVTTVDGSALRGGEAAGASAEVGGAAGSTMVRRSTLQGRYFAGGAAPTTLADSSIEGRGVHGGSGTHLVLRTRIVGPGPVVSVEAPSGDEAILNVVDSTALATTWPSGNTAAIAGTAGFATARLNVRGSTIVVRGTQADPASAALFLSHSPLQPNTLPSADLRNTIARREGPTNPNGADLFSGGGSITADFSAFASSRVEQGESGSVPAPGSASNFNGNPPLEADLSLPPGSPVIDRGDPSVVEAGELDVAGAPRSLDGNGDCVAVPDIGAFERTDGVCPPKPAGPGGEPGGGNGGGSSGSGVPANVAPGVTRFGITNRVFAPRGKVAAAGRRRVKRGTRFRYTLSEAATVSIAIERATPGRRVGRRCVRQTRRNRARRRCTRYVRVGTLTAAKPAGAQSTAFDGRVRRRALRPGRYRARITAKDAQGATSTPRTLTFRVVKAPRRR